MSEATQRQADELEAAKHEADEAITRAKRAVWAMLVGDGQTPWEDAFEPDEQPEPPDYRRWPKGLGPK